ncbi:hypothetical protein yrohd0001_19650 [Yersinia rohdei ATCC 43380]|nr:hypothetical protein yrohd0001_19650 [Yersinia rohdei ATCC 43380]
MFINHHNQRIAHYVSPYRPRSKNADMTGEIARRAVVYSAAGDV